MFEPFESQLWVAQVYGYQHTYLMADVHVAMSKDKVRVCEVDSVLKQALAWGRARIVEWAQSLRDGGATMDAIQAFAD